MHGELQTTRQQPEERRLSVIDTPEFREAVAAMRTALEQLHAEVGPVIERATSLPDQADLIEITDQDSAEFADEWVRAQVLATKAEAERIVRPFTRFGDVLHKSFVALLKLAADPCDRAKKSMDDKTVAHNNRVEAARIAIQLRAKLEREAVEYKARVHRAIYLLAVTIAQVAELAKEREEIELAAQKADQAGDPEVAEALREEAKRPQEPTIQPELPTLAPEPTPIPFYSMPEPVKLKGTATRDNWKGRLMQGAPDSMDRLIAYVAQDIPARKYLLELCQESADRDAKNHKANLSKVIPGLEAWNDQGVTRKKR